MPREGKEVKNPGPICSGICIFFAVAAFLMSTTGGADGFEIIALIFMIVGGLIFAVSFGSYVYQRTGYKETDFGNFSTKIYRKWKNDGWSQVAIDSELEFKDCRITTLENSYFDDETETFSAPIGNNKVRETTYKYHVLFVFRIIEFEFPSSDRCAFYDSKIRQFYSKNSNRHIKHLTFENRHIVFEQYGSVYK